MMTFVRYLKVNRMAVVNMFLWQTGFIAVGVLMVLIINGFVNEDPDYACMGALFSLAAIAVNVFARGNVNGCTRISLALSMGQTRRSYLLCDPLISIVIGMIGIVGAWCVYQVESRLYHALYPGFRNDMPLDGFFRLKYIIPVLIALVLLDFVFTAITVRFGWKSFRIIWLCFCFSFLIIPRAIDASVEGSTSLFARIGSLLITVVTVVPVPVWIGVGAAAVLVVLGYTIQVLRKVEVKL